MKRIEKFKAADGREPFSEWFQALSRNVQAKVDAYIVRTAMGAASKNVKRLSGKRERDIFEIRIDTGPGYRVYFAELGRDVMLLLLGGIKKNQRRDIASAVRYWRSYNVSK